jgi:hypothetical protein
MTVRSIVQFARIAAAIVVASFAMGGLHRALGLDNLDGLDAEIVSLAFLLAAMFLASLSDRELFWATPPKRRHWR